MSVLSVARTLKCSRLPATLSKHLHGRWAGFVAISAAALVLASCQSQAQVSQQPLELSPALSTSQSVLSVAAPYSPSEVLVTGRSGPYWALISFDTQTHQTQFITPAGVSTRGGIAVAANGFGAMVAGVHAYQSLLLSPVYFSSTNGRSWTTAELNHPLAPIRKPIALTQHSVYIAVSKSNGSEVVLRSSLPGVSNFSQIQSPPGLHSVVALYGYSGGVLALYKGVGTTAVTYEATYSSATGNWTSYGGVPSTVRGTSIASGSQGGEVASTCVPVGKSSGSVTLAVRTFLGTVPKATLETIPSTTSSSTFLGCSTQQVNPKLVVAVWSKVGSQRVLVNLIGSHASSVSMSSYSVPASSDSSLELLSFDNGLFLYSGTPAQVELRDLANSTNFSGTINGVLAYVFKQARAN